jgi:hypothetical protein
MSRELAAFDRRKARADRERRQDVAARNRQYAALAASKNKEL